MTDFKFLTEHGFLGDAGSMSKTYNDVPATVSVKQSFGQSRFVCKYEYHGGYKFAGAFFYTYLMIYEKTREDMIKAIEDLNERIKNAQK